MKRSVIIMAFFMVFTMGCLASDRQDLQTTQETEQLIDNTDTNNALDVTDMPSYNEDSEAPAW